MKTHPAHEQEAELWQRDCMTHCVSWNLVNCCTFVHIWKGLQWVNKHTVDNTRYTSHGIQVRKVSNSGSTLKVIGIAAIQYATYNFQVVLHCNYVSVLHHFQGVISYFAPRGPGTITLPLSLHFPTSPSFSLSVYSIFYFSLSYSIYFLAFPFRPILPE